MKKAKKLFAIALVIALLIPALSACKVDAFPGGIDTLFDAKYNPESALIQLLSSDKYKKLNDFAETFKKAATPQKLSFDLKVNKFNIMEGIALDSSNKIGGAITYFQSKSEGNFDLAFMGNKLNANFFSDDKNLVAQLPDVLEKYINIPMGEILSGGTQLDTDFSTPSAGELMALEGAFNELYAKMIEIIKKNTPEGNIENRKREVSYGGKIVKADLVALKLSGKDMQKIGIEALEYIKNNDKIIDALNPIIVLYFQGESLDTIINDILTALKNIDDAVLEKTKVNVVATFVKSKLIAYDATIDVDKDITSYVFYSDKKGALNTFTFEIKTPDNENFKIVYDEDTKSNEYKLTITGGSGEEAYDIVLTLTIPDDSSFLFKFKLNKPDTVEFTVNCKIVEVTDKAVSFKVNFLMDDKVDIELNYKAEILDSYTFNIPTLSAENSYDITDDDQAAVLLEELGESLDWLKNFFPAPNIETPDVVIDYNETEEYETNGELMPAAFADILDGDGAYSVSNLDFFSCMYVFADKVINYSLWDHMNEEDFVYSFLNGEWYDEEGQIVQEEDIGLLLHQNRSFLDEAEFVGSGFATYENQFYIYESFFYQSSEMNITYLFDDTGILKFASDGIFVYEISLFKTIDDLNAANPVK